MPAFILTSPEGQKFKVTGPEGATAEQALANFQKMRPELFAPKAPKEESQESSFLGKVKDVVFPSTIPSDPAAEKDNTLARIPGDVPRAIRRQQAKATEAIRGGFGEMTKGGLLHPALGALNVVGGGLSYVTSPLSGLAQATILNPISRATGRPEISEYGGMGVDLLATWPGAMSKGLVKLGLAGASKFAGVGDRALAAGGAKVGESLEKGTLGAIRNVFSPESASKEAQAAYEVSVEMMAKAARETAVSAETLSHFDKVVNKLSQPEQLDLLRAILGEGGRTVPEELRPMQVALRGEYDKRQRILQELGTLERFNENYAHLIWKDTKTAAEFFPSGGGRGSLAGAPTSLRAKTLKTIDEGLERGLELATTNPLILAMHSIAESDRFITAHQAAREFERVGSVIRETNPANVPKGWQQLNDRIFGKDYYAAPSVLRLFDRIERPSALSGPLYDKIRGFQNAMNHAQLAIPGFHFLFESRDSVTSEMARAVKMLVSGEFKEAGKRAVRALDPTMGIWTGLSKMRKGEEMMQVYKRLKPASPEMQQIMEGLIAGGGRAGMDQMLRLTREGSFWKSMKEGWLTADLRNTWNNAGLAAPLKVVGRLLETMSAPLMEYYVPRAKLGVFYGMAEDWLKLHPTANHTEMRAAMQRIWASVDNRMGEMVYDNLMWSKTTKDIAYMTTRAVGWNLGTVREIFGAMVDLVRNGAKLMKTGDFKAFQDAFTERMAYATAMPIMTMLHGAVLTYLFTGRGPQSMMDYFFPPTGATLASGAEARISQAGYDKDVYEYLHHPVATLIGKMHPTIPFLNELFITNRDYAGRTIVTPPDIQRMQGIPDSEIAWNMFADAMRYTGEKFMPIGQVGDLMRKGITAATGTQFPRRRQDVIGEESVLVDILKFMGMSYAPLKITDPEREQQLTTKFSDLPAYRKYQRSLQ